MARFLCVLGIFVLTSAQLTMAANITLPSITFHESAINGNDVGNTSDSAGIVQYLNPSGSGGGVATVTI